MSESAKRSRMPISVGSLLWIALIVWFVMPSPRPTERRVNELRSELKQLRNEVNEVRLTLAALLGELPTSRERRADGESTTATDDRARDSQAAPTDELRANTTDEATSTSDSASQASAPQLSEELDVERE